MKLRTLTLASGPPGALSFRPGDEIEVGAAVGKQLIAAGAAEQIDPPATPTQKTKRKANTSKDESGEE